MPQAKYKYTKLTVKLTVLLRLIPTIGRPPKVDEAWLNSVGIVSSDPKSIVRVLRSVDLIGGNNRPTDLWDTIRDQTPENRIRFANAVRKTYKELFDYYPDANRKDNETLRVFFKGQQIGGSEVQAAARRTFRTLVPFGDFEGDAPSSVNSVMELPEFVQRVENLVAAAQGLLGKYEEIQQRILALEPLRKRLDGLRLPHNILLQDSPRAAEAGLFRPAHTLAWGGFIDFLCEHLPIDAVRREYPKWQIESVEHLHMQKEEQLIEAGKKVGLYNHAVTTTLQGLRNDRNQLSHGSGYFPKLDETTTFLTRLFRVIEGLQRRHPTS